MPNKYKCKIDIRFFLKLIITITTLLSKVYKGAKIATKTKIH